MPDKRKLEIQALQSRAFRHPLTGANLQAPDGTVERRGNVFYRLSVVKDSFQFDGMPIWLVTCAIMGAGGKPTVPGTWGDRWKALDFEMQGYLRGVGNPERERLFTTGSALNLARMITGAEWERLPVDTFHDVEPVKADGGPVLVLRENWQSRPGAYPCQNPSYRDGLEPVDCGQCPPCDDRANYETERAKHKRKLRERAELEAAYEAFMQTPEGAAWVAKLDEERRAAEGVKDGTV